MTFSLTVFAVCISIVFAQYDHDDGYNRHPSQRGHYKYDRYGSSYRRPQHHQNSHDDDYYGYNNYGRYNYGYKKIYCEKLNDPENGSVKQRGIYKGAKAVYSCDEGYILTGAKVRVCKSNGKFSGEAPTCEPVDCGQPPAPDNGDVSVDETTLGNTATQTCNRGYILQGVQVRTCLPSGKWSDQVAQCQPVDCGPLDDPENGQVSLSGTIFLSVATYTCNPGYIRVGTEVRGCQANGQWSSEAPVCQPVDCGQPEDPDDNGDVDADETTLGNTATYSCNEGYILTGSETVDCQTDGTWSDGAPECVPVDCGPLDDPENGQVSLTGTIFLSVATYTCNPGYIRVGTEVRGCQANGQWSSEAPICQPVDCGQPEDPDDNGDVDVDETTLGNTATYSCNAGYILTGSETVECQTDGTWSDGAPDCVPVDCGPLDDPENGQVSLTGTIFLSVATYTCNPGYIRVGTEVRGCQANGQWSSEAPVCQPVDCGQPEDPDDNGDVDVDETTLGNTATYSCSAGYILTGSETVDCQTDGTWSDGAPACVPVDCGPLEAPDNGKVVTEPDTTLNSVASYSCKRGFRLDGDSQRICETNGQWSGEQPSCIKIRCPKLKAPRYGKIYQSGYYPGDHVVYRCAYGYYVQGGKHRRLCQYSGEWTGSDVQCKKRSYQYAYGYKKHRGY